MIADKMLDKIVGQIIGGRGVSREDALSLTSDKVNLWDLLYGANIIKRHFLDSKVHLCSIINAKSGECAEDCKFCAQSLHHNTRIDEYPLVEPGVIKDAYYRAKDIGANGFSIVTSGNMLTSAEIGHLITAIKGIIAEKDGGPYLCLSIGQLEENDIKRLKQAGITKCHHNLETSERFFPMVCSTHSYEQRVEQIKRLKKCGMKVCSGGVFGMGESWEDRIDLAFTLKELDVDSVPLNFLIPVKGTAVAERELLSPLEGLKIIALFRYILSDKDIRICAGREKVLRDLQSLIFYAGASGMMIGGYLTQPGREVKDDLQMLRDLGVSEKIHRKGAKDAKLL